jgi:hypothetical protein
LNNLKEKFTGNNGIPLGVTLIEKNKSGNYLENFIINLKIIMDFLAKNFISLLPFARLIIFLITFDTKNQSQKNKSNQNLNSNYNSNSNNPNKEKNDSNKLNINFNEIFKNMNEYSGEGIIETTKVIKDDDKSVDILKYEVIENERWWMFVGWTKNLIRHERPLWSDVTGKNYLDFKSVFLPGDNYHWISDWKVEVSENTDDEGWEYSKDFNSKFSASTFQKYVRKRKYVRFAKKNN